MFVRLSLWLGVLCAFVRGQSELVRNGDFEQEIQGEWFCDGCKLGRNREAFKGQWSGEVTNRVSSSAGISQIVPVQANKSYFLTAHVRLTNHVPGTMYSTTGAVLQLEYTDGSKEDKRFGHNPYSRASHNWVEYGGDLTLGSKAITRARLYFHNNEAGIAYRIDSVSLKEIVQLLNWKAEANALIDRHRKADITLRLNVAPRYNRKDMQVEVELKRHAFIFGSAVQAERMYDADPVNERYRDYFYDLFEWATLENALKWKPMEPQRGVIDYEKPDRALQILQRMGIPVRGHSVFGGKDDNVPDWVKSSSNMREDMGVRINDAVAKYKGRLRHWDVNNAALHGDFFERHTGDPDILFDMFRNVRARDPDVGLFLNEYNVVMNGERTMAYLQQIRRVKAANVGLTGAGVQSHFTPNTLPDYNLIKCRLNTLSSAGVPLLVTELDVSHADVQRRAQGYETALRTYFSHPGVEGVLLWGFWDRAHWRPNAALVNGDNFAENEAGRRVRRLLKEEWSTRRTFSLASSTQHTYRGFHGDYDITIKHAGTVIHKQAFHVPSGTHKHTIDIQVH